jgi:hypothetical protein
MEYLFAGLSVLTYWETYVFCLIYMCIYMPVSVLYVHGEGFSMTKSFGASILGVLLQAFATIFLFVSVYLLIYQDFSFIDSIITAFQLALGSNSLGAAVVLFIFVVIILMFFSGGDFDFLIGILVYSMIIGGSLIPEIPNFLTTILIILIAVFNMFVPPLILIPLTNLLGISKLSLTDPQGTMTMGNTLLMNFFQTVLGLIPAMIYLSWLISN